MFVGTDFMLDFTAAPNPATWWKSKWQPDPLTLSRLGLAHSWLDPAFNVPWLLGSHGSFGCDDAEEFGNLVWFLQGIGIALDTISYCNEGKVSRQAWNGVGVWISSVWGAANFGLAVTSAVKTGAADRAGAAAGVLGSIPGFLKWMAVYPGRGTPVGAVMVLVLLGLDVVCDGAAAGIAIAQVFKSEEDGALRPAASGQ